MRLRRSYLKRGCGIIKRVQRKVAKRKYPSVSYEIADRIFERPEEVRVTVPDIHREAEVRVHTTVYSVPDLVLPQHRLSWTRIMAT